MAEQAKATKDTPRRVAAKTGTRRTTRTAATGSGGAAEAPRTKSKAGGAAVAPDDGRSEELRSVLEARLQELTTEYDEAVVTLTDLQRSRVADGAGDDQADTGTKTFEREQELSLVHGLRERVQQVEHALARLAEGKYGSCERCGNPIPTARLEAFPSVTLCVSCKQIEERR
ncbi:TraR/DksA family transcriptional regulator [Cryptosporangium aurantiacum]|uniref:Transcriptional regulator, TraR/DksA family n=1 Tax=Cryptosporangium aurantiacum TaxID=134849 RepID=A0A1M7I6B6_9ACTN|nr:TraR/DksA family transcriptional regulator [Cryptosporangium aurantiacum]SHM36169.1 transcriptional regulator, TraR/DksA family [Cryptosporangium aurantiacum]